MLLVLLSNTDGWKILGGTALSPNVVLLKIKLSNVDFNKILIWGEVKKKHLRFTGLFLQYWTTLVC